LPYTYTLHESDIDDLPLPLDDYVPCLTRKAVATLIYFRPIPLLKYKDALRYKQQQSIYLGIRYHNGRTNDKTYNGREGVGLVESTGKYWERITEFVGCEIGYFTWREGWAGCQRSEAGIRGEDQEGDLDFLLSGRRQDILLMVDPGGGVQNGETEFTRERTQL
jgi:hypothetical protein